MQKANIIISMAVTLLIAPLCLAGDLEYEIYSDGKLLGKSQVDTQVNMLGGDTEVTTHSTTRLRAKALFVTLFSLDEDETCVFDSQGLSWCKSKLVIDGDEVLANIQRDSSGFRLEVITEGETEAWYVARHEFDFTSYENPVNQLTSPGVSTPFRVLDLDEYEVIEYEFVWLRDEAVTLDDNQIACSVLEITSRNSKSRRWLAKDALNTLIKEEGVDGDGAFRVVLKKYPAEFITGRDQ